MSAAGVVIGIVGVCFPGRRLEEIRIAQIWRSNPAWYAKDHLLFGAVRVDCANDVAARVVVHLDPLATLSVAWLYIVPAEGEERLVLLDHSALVVIDLPTADHDVWILQVGILLPGDIPERGCPIALVGRQDCAAEDLITENHIFGLRPRL